MNKISKYNDFLLEKEFNSIVDELFRIVEDVEGKWTSPNTIEWDYTKKEEEEPQHWSDRIADKILDYGEIALNKLREFISKIPKEKIKGYFIRLMNRLKDIPASIRRKLIIGYTSVFLTVISLNSLISTSPTEASVPDNSVKTEQLDPQIKKEIVALNKKSSFEEAQKLVKTAEAGYSDDRGDNGNYITVPGGRRFIGTNHGISAPILDNYFKSQGVKRLLTKDDMINLSYQTALKIYKSDYWDAQNLSELSDQNVANIIYDGCVNQGKDAMRSIVRDALEENGVEISDNDIIFSKKILSKANEVDQEKLFNSIKKFRGEKYKQADTWSRHGEGWMNRLDGISYIPTENQNNLS